MTRMTRIKAKADTVTLTRAEYEALIAAAEDAEDRAIIAAARAREEALGFEAAHADSLPLARVKQLSSGIHPVRVWRQHRGLTLEALADAAGISRSYLNEVETAKKPGSLDAMTKIARALGIKLDDLTAWL